MSAPPDQPSWMRGLKVPLINRLVNRALAPEPENFSEARDKVLAQLRPYSAASVAATALDALDTGHMTRVQKLQTAPWLALLLVKWKLLQSDAPVDFGRNIPPETFYQLRQRLWLANTMADGEDFNLTALLRSSIAGQMEFQRGVNPGFMRWPALIGRLDPNHGVRQQFRAAMGMDTEAFIDLGMATYTAANQSKVIDRSFFEPLRPVYGSAIDTFLALVSRSLVQLRNELRGDPSQQFRVRTEVRETPYLRRYPILEMPDRLVLWHPDVFARGLEDAAHLRLATQFGDQYATRFGAVFEDYVLEQLTFAGISYIRDKEIQRRVPRETKVAEAIFQSDGSNVFVEAKMGLFGDQLLARDDPPYIHDRTKNIRKAIDQGWAMSKLVREYPDQFGAHATAEQDFLLIVTSREAYLSGGLMLQRLYPANRLDYPDGEDGALLRRHMPLQNIFVVSVADYEYVLGHVRASGKPLGRVLREAAQANADPRTSAFTLAMHLDGQPGRPRPPLLARAMADCQARLGQALGVTITSDVDAVV